MPANSISGLPKLSQTALDLNDVIAVVSLGAAETRKITASDFLLGVVEDLPVNSIDGTKVDIDLSGAVLTTDNIGDKTITAEKLADEATWIVDPATPAAGEFVGQALLNTTTGYAYVWNGSAWVGFKAVNSINSIAVANDPRNIQLASSQTGDEVTLAATYGTTAIPRQFLAGPTASGGNISQRGIAPNDLPLATDTTVGAIAAGGGLTVDGNGSLSIDNAVAESTVRSVVTYDDHGLVTGGGPITPSDLPTATEDAQGAVVPGDYLTVNAGELTIDNTVIPSAGSYVKVTVNEVGLVTQGDTVLDPTDIPTLSYDQIQGGDIDTTYLPDESIGANHLKDYTTCFMQESQPSGDFLGQLWYTPSTAQLRVYARGSDGFQWLPVGFGALQANNLRWLGTYDAATDTIGVVTAIGVSEGISAGQPFPVPSDQLSGGYFLCQVPGNSMSQPNINGISHDAGDWALCVNDAEGWVHIDAAAAGGGGGGSTQYLNDLLDVEIGGASGPFSTAPAMTLSNKQIFKYDGGSGVWRNTDLLDGGSF
jgi:hypothetical protein